MTPRETMNAWVRFFGLSSPFPGCPECRNALDSYQSAAVAWTLATAWALLDLYRVDPTGPPTSLVRCPPCNARRGGTEGSRHQVMMGPGKPFAGVDIPIRDAQDTALRWVSEPQLDALAESIGWPYGIGLIIYRHNIHVDLRERSWKG